MSKIDPVEYQSFLVIYRTAYIYGLIGKEVKIYWADEILKKEDNPEYSIIELSLIGSLLYS